MLAVIAIPEFDVGAAAWIDALRRAHDPQYDRVPAHVTLAFPQAIADPDWFSGHVASTAATAAPLAVSFDRLERMEDAYHPKYRYLNVLLADEASAMPLVSLYRMLGGNDASYRPHLTLARFGAIFSAKALKRQLGGLDAPIHGRVASLTLLAIESGAIRKCAAYPLSG
jgi:2'-5' RNA ligase